MIYNKTYTMVRADGGMEVGHAGSVLADALEESIRDARALWSREAGKNANILTVEEAHNTIVVIFDNGAVTVHKWLPAVPIKKDEEKS